MQQETQQPAQEDTAGAPEPGTTAGSPEPGPGAGACCCPICPVVRGQFHLEAGTWVRNLWASAVEAWPRGAWGSGGEAAWESPCSRALGQLLAGTWLASIVRAGSRRIRWPGSFNPEAPEAEAWLGRCPDRRRSRSRKDRRVHVPMGPVPAGVYQGDPCGRATERN